MLDSASPEERDRMQRRITEKISAMREYWRALPMDFDSLWSDVGLSTGEKREACFSRAETIFKKLGFSLDAGSAIA